MIMKQISVSGQTMTLTILCLFGLLAFCQAGIFKLDPRIVNGENAKEGEFPFQVSLEHINNLVHFCSGSIISKNYVITTARCVQNEISNSMQISAGMTDLKDRKSNHSIQHILIHEKFNASNSNINDIALLKVEPSFDKNLTEVLPLPLKTDILKTGDKAVVSGWGIFSEMGEISNELKKAEIRISDQNYCYFIYNSLGKGFHIHDEQVCAFEPTIERGPCQGDTGGPLTIKGKLVGLVSWGNLCASKIYPSVFTRVVKYLDWIKINAELK